MKKVALVLVLLAYFIIPGNARAQTPPEDDKGYCTFLNTQVLRQPEGTGYYLLTEIDISTLEARAYDVYINFYGDLLHFDLSGNGPEFSVEAVNPPTETYKLYKTINDRPLSGTVTGREASVYVARQNDTNGYRYCSVGVTFPEDLKPGDPSVPGRNEQIYDEVRGKCAPGYVDSAIGCIPYNDFNATAAFFLSWSLGIGGGIALVLIVLGAIRIINAKGDADEVASGRNLITAAIAGLFMLALTVFALRVISVNILGLFGT